MDTPTRRPTAHAAALAFAAFLATPLSAQRATPDPLPGGATPTDTDADTIDVGDVGPDGPPPDLSAVMSLAELDEGGPRGLRLRTDAASPGYTLFEPLNSRTIYLIDLDGEVVHSWPTNSSPGGWVYLQDDGTLYRAGRRDEDPHFKGGGIGGFVQRIAPDGSLLWDYRFADEQAHQHHDVEVLPNGNVIFIAWEKIGGRDALRYSRDPRTVDREKGWWPDMLVEVRPIEPDGAEVVWEWHAKDHLVQDVSDRSLHFGDPAVEVGRIDVHFPDPIEEPATEEEQAEEDLLEEQMAALGYVGGDDEEDEDASDEYVTDWLHTNAVDYLPAHDLLVMSSPHLCEIYVIDHSTTTAEAAGSTGGRFGKGGELLWRWGNPLNYRHGERADRHLSYQHDPRWLPTEDPDELRLLVFNNGGRRPDGSNYSAVEELVLPFDPERGFVREPGQPYGPAEPVWSYSHGDGFYSAFISGSQRLPNGNTLICSGAPGRLFEVTPAGEVVWDYRNGFGGDVDPPEHAGRAPPLALYRVDRYAPDHPGIVALLGR